MIQSVKNSEPNLFKDFFCPSLLETQAFHLNPSHTNIKLDQNESFCDWPDSLKKRISSRLLKKKWNLYPEDYPYNLQEKIANYANLPSSNMVLCPGSNYHITSIIDLLTHFNYDDLIIARPSFPLYENHCKYRGIPYKVWPLNSDLQYDIAKLPTLSKRSIILFASPNNPVGNVIKMKTLERLLQENPNCLFIADEAYYEYASEPFTPLLKDYSNLILIRTFSKALSSAGIRLGYTIANENFCQQLKKITLPFLINIFTTIACEEALDDLVFLKKIEDTTKNCIQERNNIFSILNSMNDNQKFRVFPSQANFLLIQFQNENILKVFENNLQQNDITARNVSNPSLKNALRISVGKPEENQKLIHSFEGI